MCAIVADLQAQGLGRMRVVVVNTNSHMTWGDKGGLHCFGPRDGRCVGMRRARFQQAGIGDP